MKIKIKTVNLVAIGGLLSVFLLLVSCSKDRISPLNKPYLRVTALDLASAGPIQPEQSFVGVYMIQMSSKSVTKELQVEYEIISGKALVEGIDYEVLNQDGGKITFPLGVYEMPIRIRWIPQTEESALENNYSAEDYTLTIRLVKNNLDLGVEGFDPKKFRDELKIHKERKDIK